MNTEIRLLSIKVLRYITAKFDGLTCDKSCDQLRPERNEFTPYPGSCDPDTMIRCHQCIRDFGTGRPPELE